jgi:hypothetical protein
LDAQHDLVIIERASGPRIRDGAFAFLGIGIVKEMIRLFEILGNAFLIPKLGIRLAKLPQHFI